MGKGKNRTISGFLSSVAAVYKKLRTLRTILNNKMDGRYSPHRLALAATLAVFLIWLIMLILTPAHGLADDGTLSKAMGRAGLSYIEQDPEDVYHNYFIRIYAVDTNYRDTAHKMETSQDFLIRIAVLLDEMVKKDNYFDIRSLAFVYGIFYFPAVYLLVKGVCRRLYNFSEALLVAGLSILIFGDISYLSYFNSLYPEAVWFLCLLYLVGAASMLQYPGRRYPYLLILLLSGGILCMSRRQCGVIGFLLAAFSLMLLFLDKKPAWRVSCILLSFAMSGIGVISLNTLSSDFDLTSKYHSMTRGILFQASNPERALNELGIDPSYTVLANTSAYDYYPFVLPDSKQLQEGFYDRFTSSDLMVYYLKHPGSMFRMLDLAVKETMSLRREFCGNFEKIKGMPKMAQSILWAGWSVFKERSMPKTIGFFLLLLAASYLFYGRRIGTLKAGEAIRDSRIMMSLITLIAAIGLSQAVVSIIMSGDAEFNRRAFLMGAAMDLLMYLLFTEVLPKMKIMEEERDVG